ncbi:MAG: cell division protein FtsL [Pseudomonadota bacterium]
MTRLNLLLLAILIACALSVVTSQHKARKLFIELQKAQKSAKQLDVEWGRLQLEQSTWAMHSRIESIASKQLSMRVPDASRIQVMPGQTTAAPIPAQPQPQQ